jgi:hypothetical protein
MRERIYVYDRSGNLVNDPTRSLKYPSGLRWETMWPKGYGPLNCNVERGVTEAWAVKLAHEIVVRDGQRIIYQGRLGSLGRQLNQPGGRISIPASGWYVVLNERFIRKRWIDNAPIGRLEWETTSDEQESFRIQRRENFLQVVLVDRERDRYATERYRERYRAPGGTKVARVTLDWKRRTGEGAYIGIYNIESSSTEWSVSGTTAEGSADVSFATPTRNFNFEIGPSAADLYNTDDYAFVDNVVVYCQMDNFPSPTYHANEIIQDILYLKGDEISSDYDEIGDPGLVLSPFVTENDDYESPDSIIQRAAAYGDAALNTWGLCVWDSMGASDGKPKAVFEARDVSDYEYAIHLDDLEQFQDGEAEDELYNYVVIKYSDDKGIARYRTPDDNAGLMDQASIDEYGQREKKLDIGAGDVTRADYVGERYIAYHKEPLHKTEMAIKGRIRTKAKEWVPCNRVRAGQRVKVIDYQGGQVYFLRHTAYDADSQVLQMSPDLPLDDLAMFFAQEKLG